MYIRNTQEIIKVLKTYLYCEGFYDKETLKEDGIDGIEFYHNEEKTRILSLFFFENNDEYYLVQIYPYDDPSDVLEEYTFDDVNKALEFIKSL